MGQNSDLKSDIVLMGRIGAPYGVQGWVHVHSFAEPPSNLLQYKTWYLRLKGAWVAVAVLASRVHGKAFVSSLEGVSTRDQALTLTNLDIGVPRAALPELAQDEYYWADLIGMAVETGNGIRLGTVTGCLETGSNDVLVVQGEQKSHLIPYIPGDYVLEVNRTACLIRVSWDPEF